MTAVTYFITIFLMKKTKNKHFTTQKLILKQILCFIIYFSEKNKKGKCRFITKSVTHKMYT